VGICKGEAGCLVEARIGSGEGIDEKENERKMKFMFVCVLYGCCTVVLQ
jgi:hypothetical protein